MPNLVGLSFSTARARMKEMNLSLWAIVPQSAPAPSDSGEDADTPPAPTVIAGPIASQVPVAGARVTAGDNPHVTMTRGYSAPAVTAPATPAEPGAGTPSAPVTQPAAPIVRLPPAH